MVGILQYPWEEAFEGNIAQGPHAVTSFSFGDRYMYKMNDKKAGSLALTLIIQGWLGYSFCLNIEH